MPRKKTTEEFREELKQLFPNLELIGDYINDKSYITVKCTIHDYTFNTKPVWLRHGHGCKKCYDERRGSTLRNNLDDVISRAIKIHGDKYDYSKITSYKNGHTKVPIVCPKHGVFMMTLNHHISGQGCPKCAGKHKTTEEVINEFKKIHGDKYDYSKVEYVNNKTKVTIICPKHGEFLQTPDKHLLGEGCPMCRRSKLETAVEKFLTENNYKFEEQQKFDWLGKQSLDFYLLDYNVAIECQGEQHFKEYRGKRMFKKNDLNGRIKLDITKNVLCNENNVKMIYVMAKQWKNTSFSQKFNGIYTNENIVLINELDRIENLLK